MDDFCFRYGGVVHGGFRRRVTQLLLDCPMSVLVIRLPYCCDPRGFPSVMNMLDRQDDGLLTCLGCLAQSGATHTRDYYFSGDYLYRSYTTWLSPEARETLLHDLRCGRVRWNPGHGDPA